MGKSSSSLNKKRSKNFLKVRSKTRRKSRTRRNYKLKKLCRRDDSVSYSSDGDDSRTSVSVSCPSSEDNYRRKRFRSRKQKDVKVSKKRVQQWSSSSESIEDSSRVKKRKGSKRNDDFLVRKKNREKKNKKPKRDMSVSFTSSGSQSCSTCRGGSTSSSSDESEVEKKRGRSEKKDGESRRPEKMNNVSKRRRLMSRNCSSCSQYSDYINEDKLIGETNSMRLRSVITITRDGKEGKVMDNDEHKEEMLYDRDDCPSSRSNYSNDGGSKRELIYNSFVAHEEKKNAEDEKGEAVVSNIRTCKVMGSDKDGESHEMNDDVKAKTNKYSGTDDSLSYNLESILRQRALENLRMFRRGHQTGSKVPATQKDVIGSEVNTPSSTKSELLQNRSLKVCDDRVMGASQVKEPNNISTNLSQDDDKISNRNESGKESGSAKHDVEHPPGQPALAGNPKEKVSVTVSSEFNESRSVALASRQESSNVCTAKKVIPTLQETCQAKSTTGNRVDKGKVKTAETATPPNGNCNQEETNNVFASDDPSSCTKSLSGGSSSNKLQDEANEGSQFRQKTMSVIRGGEMVEVSYKVYIPKKAPALARRPLKR